MSSDPRINSALFNFCIAADDGPRNPPSEEESNKYPRASLDDLRWLREAMESVEAPDRIMQRHVATIVLATERDSS